MFTGIIEELAEVVAIKKEGENLVISLSSNITDELKIDQSVSHNGVCLTVVDINNATYSVVAVKETLDKTNFRDLKKGSKVNIERSLKLGSRLDGHIVQGHIDQTATCLDIQEMDGSWLFNFKHNVDSCNFTVEKGSVTINGVSLTVINSQQETFSVAIIPYTYEHTNFNTLSVGDIVNIEFDILGKYIAKIMSLKN